MRSLRELSPWDRGRPRPPYPDAAGGGHGPKPSHGVQRVLTMATLILAALAFYRNSFSVPFVYDDVPAIAGNPSIHQLSSALFPPAHLTTSGRPVVNLSLALNYALGRTDVRGYHAFNLAIHVLAALTLFAIV